MGSLYVGKFRVWFVWGHVLRGFPLWCIVGLTIHSGACAQAKKDESNAFHALMSLSPGEADGNPCIESMAGP